MAQQVRNALTVVEETLFHETASAEWAVDVADALADEFIMTELARKQLECLS